MGDKSRIEWTDASWNPVTGCSKVSQGCKHCYAEREWARLSGRGQPYEGRAFIDVLCHPERLDQPLRWRRPRRVFVNSMSDLFHEAVPDEFIDRVFAVMALAPQHTFQVLTKRPERMRAYLGGPGLSLLTEARIGARVMSLAHSHGENVDDPHWDTWWAWPLRNVWLGVSVEDQATADERIPLLLDTPATVRWLSAEPLLGPVDIGPYLSPHFMPEDGSNPENHKLDWVVVGGESGPHARPMHPDWARSLRDQCIAAGVRFFFKQWGEWQTIADMSLDAINRTPGTAPGHRFADGSEVYRCGKARAGRLLDGRTWDEYPA